LGGISTVNGANEQRDPHVVVRGGVLQRAADGGVAESPRRALDVKPRRLVDRWAPPLLLRGAVVETHRHHVGGMQVRAVRGIDRAFEHLRPVAVDVHLDDAGANAGEAPTRAARKRRCGGIAHPDPDEATRLAARVGPMLAAAIDPRRRRLDGRSTMLPSTSIFQP
jgi:hypothetical protein